MCTLWAISPDAGFTRRTVHGMNMVLRRPLLLSRPPHGGHPNWGAGLKTASELIRSTHPESCLLISLHHLDQKPAPSGPTFPKTAGSAFTVAGRGVWSVVRTGARFSFPNGHPTGAGFFGSVLIRANRRNTSGGERAGDGIRTQCRVEKTSQGEQMTAHEHRSDRFTADEGE